MDNAWHLFDATWGSGYVDGHRFVRDYGEFWFDPHPELFLRTHLPAEVDWQLISDPIDMKEYLAQPFIASYVYEHLYDLGFDDQEVLDAVANGAGLPFAYSFSGHGIRVLQAPLQELLPAGEEVSVVLHAPGVSEGAFINNREFSYLTLDGDTLIGTILPVRGQLKVTLKINHNRRTSFWTLLEYEVQ